MGDYLRLRKGIYHFRRKVPINLIEILGVQEIIRSTRTGERRLAQRRSREFLVATDSLFELANVSTNMDLRKLEALARRYYQHKLDFWETGMARKTDKSHWPPIIEQFLQGAKLDLLNNRRENAESEVTSYCQETGETIPKDRIEYETLLRLIQRANISWAEVLKARHTNDYSFTPDDSLFASAGEYESVLYNDNGVSAGADQIPSNLPFEKTVPLLSEVIEASIEELRQNNDWKQQTLLQNQTTIRRFLEVAGDRPIDQYGRQDIAVFIKKLRKLPKHWGKSPKDKALSIDQIIKKHEGLESDGLKNRTLKRHRTTLKVFFDFWISEATMTGDNPVDKFKLPKDKEATKQGRNRKPWQTSKLVNLFSSPVWQGSKSLAHQNISGDMIYKNSRYWLPILSLYHGNRLEEFAQLRRSDLVEEDGIFCFDIHGGQGYQIKNSQSARKIPVHPFIIELGFLTYVNEIGNNPSDMIFPDLKPGGPDNKFGYKFSNWFADYRKKIGVYESGVDYHSFRHTFNTQLRNNKIDIDVAERLMGHDSGARINSSVYLHELNLELLAEAIATLKWPDVEALLLNSSGPSLSS